MKPVDELKPIEQQAQEIVDLFRAVPPLEWGEEERGYYECPLCDCGAVDGSGRELSHVAAGVFFYGLGESMTRLKAYGEYAVEAAADLAQAFLNEQGLRMALERATAELERERDVLQVALEQLRDRGLHCDLNPTRRRGDEERTLLAMLATADDLVRRVAREALQECAVPTDTRCAKPNAVLCAREWEVAHQHRWLQHHGLQDRFGSGCDSIGQVCEALLAAEAERNRFRRGITLVACAGCGMGVRHRETADGRCAACLLRERDQRTAILRDLISAEGGSDGRTIFLPLETVRGLFERTAALGIQPNAAASPEAFAEAVVRMARTFTDATPEELKTLQECAQEPRCLRDGCTNQGNPFFSTDYPEEGEVFCSRECLRAYLEATTPADDLQDSLEWYGLEPQQTAGPDAAHSKEDSADA